MNGYELTEKLRKTRRRYRLSAPTQALYYELVAICNEEKWPDEFKCSNDELCAALQISEKSLIIYRQELIQSGLIFYFSGKSKKKISTYSFSKELFDGWKFFSQSDSLKGSQSGNQSGSQRGEKGSDSIETKIEIKTETELFIVIGKEKKIISVLQNLFQADEGLKMKWTGNGYPAAEFSNGVEQWMMQVNGQEYHDFQKARNHFFFWLPNYSKPQKKNNGPKTYQRAAGAATTETTGDSTYAGGF